MDAGTHAAAGAGFAQGVVQRVLDDALAAGVGVYGIAGLQGSGKSTLAAQLVALARARGIRAVALSIDDFYLDRPQREALARDVHPLLATRGPPGTHDVALACDTLDALARGAPVALPRFDKIDDRRLPVASWATTDGCDLVLLEGWCLCVPPQSAAELVAPLNALERDEDRDGRWRRHCNRALARDYPALWQRIGRLLFLQGPGFDVVPGWRRQQEHTLQLANPGREVMQGAQVARFVQHFERVSRQALATLPGIADAVAVLDGHRQPQAWQVNPPRK